MRQKPCWVIGASIEFATVAARNLSGQMMHILQALAAESDKALDATRGYDRGDEPRPGHTLVWHQDSASTCHLGPLTPACLWTLGAPPAGAVRALEAGWVAGPPLWAGWAG